MLSVYNTFYFPYTLPPYNAEVHRGILLTRTQYCTGVRLGDQIFYVNAYRVSVACARRHRKLELNPTLLSLIVVYL